MSDFVRFISLLLHLYFELELKVFPPYLGMFECWVQLKYLPRVGYKTKREKLLSQNEFWTGGDSSVCNTVHGIKWIKFIETCICRYLMAKLLPLVSQTSTSTTSVFRSLLKSKMLKIAWCIRSNDCQFCVLSSIDFSETNPFQPQSLQANTTANWIKCY